MKDTWFVTNFRLKNNSKTEQIFYTTTVEENKDT